MSVHKIEVVDWVEGSDPATIAAFRLRLERICTAVGSASSAVTISAQGQPEHGWIIHPAVDGCRPHDQDPDGARNSVREPHCARRARPRLPVARIGGMQPCASESQLESVCVCQPAAVAGSVVLSLYLAANAALGPWAASGPAIATGFLLSTAASWPERHGALREPAPKETGCSGNSRLAVSALVRAHGQ